MTSSGTTAGTTRQTSITPREFADHHLNPYKVHGDEIIPLHCPYCHGGHRHDKNTFALNEEKRTYNCRRGSCAKQGRFEELCKDFGETAERSGFVGNPTKAYKKPEQKPVSITESAMQYLKLRGLSEKTIADYRVGVDAKGNLMFPYYDEKGEHVFNKFRPARKLSPGERKAWREGDTKPVLFGMHLTTDKRLPLTITEGEIDAMSLYESGVFNAVSVPSGAEDFTWLDTCWEYIRTFDAIFLFGDNDDPGRTMIRKLQAKLANHRVYIVEHEEKDANMLLYKQGREAVHIAWGDAKETPIKGLIRLADAVPMDLTNMPKARTSIKALNQMLGGFLMGDVTVWTGKRGEGKSTVLSQLMLDAVEDGQTVCAYSGELSANRYQYWTDLQAAGREYVKEHFDERDQRTVCYIDRYARDLIHAWYYRKYWLYDNTATLDDEAGDVLKIFERAARRHDCNVFLIDNLMTVDYGDLPEKDFYLRQGRFINKLADFASLYNAHVHLIAHPRKTGEVKDSDDVSGSGVITNRVANVIAVKKCASTDGCDLKLDIIKNRWEGKVGEIRLMYDDKARRVFETIQSQSMRYGWVPKGFIPVDEPTPFEEDAE